MIVDVTISVASYFITKYVSPEHAKDVLFVIVTMQPVVVSLIIGITAEDVAARLSNSHPTQLAAKMAQVAKLNERYSRECSEECQ